MSYEIQFPIRDYSGVSGRSYTYIVKANLPVHKVVEVPEYGLYN